MFREKAFFDILESYSKLICMSWNTLCVRSLQIVGIFCFVVSLQSSVAVADDMSEKDFLAFFADEAGYEFGGVIARTLGEEQVVWLGAPEAGTAELKLYELSEERFLNALVYPARRKDDQYNTKLARFPVKLEGLEPRARLSVDVASATDRARISLPINKPGTYYLEGNMGGRHGEMLLVASNIVAQTKEEGKNLVVWTVDSRTGRHVKSGEAIQYELNQKKKEIDRSAIDAQGLARLSSTEEGDIVFLRSGGELAFIPLNYASHVPQPVNYGWWGGRFAPYATLSRSYSFLDRMLYQPGDKVYFKSILRRDDDARYSIPDGVAQVKIWTGWGEEETVVLEKSYPIVDGAVNGEFVLPKDAKTGDYYYAVSYSGLSRQSGFYFPTSEAMFTVDYYRKPEFGLDLAVARDRLIVGDTLEFDISGSYFSGELAIGKKVEYRVTGGTYTDYGYLSNESTLDDGYRYGGWYGPLVDTGEVTLGLDGAYRVTVPTRAQEKNLTQVYHIEVSASDTSENPVYESRNVLVLPGDFSLYRSSYAYGSRVGETQALDFQLVANREGVSLADRSFVVRVKHERWVNDSPSARYPYYTKREKDLSDLSLVTDSTGKATLSFAPPEEGSYSFDISGTDDRGNTIVRQARLWASDRNGWFYQSAEDGKSLLSIKTDKESYAPHETAKVTLASSLPDRDVWLSVERAGVRRSQIVSLKGNTASLDLPLEQGDMPNIFLSGTMFSDIALATAMTDVAVSAESERITVELRSDKERYEPGETVSLEVVGKDDAGKAVAGEVAVWAIDKALFELMDQSPADIFKTFWDERYHDTLSAHSLEGVLFSLNLAERGGCFVGETQVLMQSGMSKPIAEVAVGDTVLTRLSEEDATLVPAKVTGTHVVNVDGYLVFNNQLKVTPEHKMYVNGVWGPAGNIQVGDVLVDTEGRTVTIDTIEFVREKVPVYNLAIDTYHTYFAGGLWVHNNKSGGIRSAFKDTAYWNPRVRLGSNGKARVTFKLPDNTTTWVISGVATAGASQFGQTRAEIMVSKNVVVTASLPTLMRVGDRVGVKATVRNNTGETLDFSVRGDFENGTIVDGNERVVTVGPMQGEEVILTYVPETPNDKATFTVRATAIGHEETHVDAVRHTVPVRVAGFTQKSGEARDGNTEYRVEFPADTNRLASSLVLDLAPSLLGTIPSAMRGLLDYPYGCVEQTTSRFVPLVIAHQEKGIFAEALKGKDTVSMLESGIQHLDELQNDEGGWGFWHGDESNPYVTRYVIEYLLEARALGVRQDDITAMLARARTYVSNASLEVIATREKSLPKTHSVAEQESAFTALISLAHAKSLLGLPVGKAETHEGALIPNFAEVSPELLSLVIRVNTNAGEFDTAHNGVDALMAKVKSNEVGQYWESGKIDYYASQDAATAMAIQALVAARYDHSKLTPFVRSLSASRKAGYWSNTYATVQVIRALVDFSKQGVALNPNYAYQVALDGELLATGRVSANLENTSLAIAGTKIRPEGSTLTISYEGTGELYSSLFQTLARETEVFPGESHGMSLLRTYENVTEPGATPALGDTVRVVLDVTGVKYTQNRLVVEDTLPAGMVPIHQNFKNERSMMIPESRNWTSSVVDAYTENGAVMTIYTYGSRQNQYRATYLARVVNTGEYSVPPAYATLMYTPEVYAYSASRRETYPETSVALEKPRVNHSLTDLGVTENQQEILMWLVIGLALFSATAATFLLWRKQVTP